MGSKRPVGGGAMGSEVGNEMPQTLLRRFPAYCSIVPRHDPAYYFFGFRSVFHPCFIRGSRISCFGTFRDECSIGGEGTSPSQRSAFPRQAQGSAAPNWASNRELIAGPFLTFLVGY